jgi:Zn-dependent protease
VSEDSSESVKGISAQVPSHREPVKRDLRKNIDKTEDCAGPSYYFETTYGEPYEVRRGRSHFSRTEVQHLLIALGILVLFSLSFVFPYFPLINPADFNLAAFIILTAILFISFLPHELAHKAVAQRYGLFAEFRIIPYYAFLTVVTLFLPFFKIFAPGAVMIGGDATPQSYGKTAAAGPSTNVIMGVAMLGLSFIFPDVASFLLVGSWLCGWLAFLNMLPIPPFDGEKVIHWSKAAFVVLLLWSIALFISANFLLSVF